MRFARGPDGGGNVSRIRELADAWAKRGYDLGLGIGVAQGFATLGRIGFEGRSDYAAIEASPTCRHAWCTAAATWQIPVTQRVFSSTESFAVETVSESSRVHGFSQLIRCLQSERD